MRKGTVSFLLAMLLLWSAGAALAQDMSPITVKKTDVTKGVVVVSILKAGKTYQLQCNDGVPSCVPLKSGKYQMVELPTNRGLYECSNVRVFPESTVDPEKEEKLGEYCLISG
jgi:hypothetical protein